MSKPCAPQIASLSVIIPAKDRAHELEATLLALARSGQADELIVVDDGSADETSAVAARHGARVARHETNRGAAAARNTGAREAKGDVLLFIDSDVIVPEGLLDEVRRAFADATAEALSGLLAKDSAHPNFASQYDALYMHYQYWTHPEEMDIFYTSCAAIRRPIFLAEGGFDEHYKGAGIEDMELGQRLTRNGVRLVINKRLQVAHAHPFTARELVLKNSRTAAGTLKILLRNLGSGQSSRRMVAPQWSFLMGIPMTLLAAAALHLAPLVHPAFAAIAVALLGFVLHLNRRFLGFLLRERGHGFVFLACGFLFLNYLAYAAGLVTGALGFAAGSRY